MKIRIRSFLITSSLLLFTTGLVHAGDKEGWDSPEKKKVLIELYSPQGCDFCPPAADLMGRFVLDRSIGIGKEGRVLREGGQAG